MLAHHGVDEVGADEAAAAGDDDAGGLEGVRRARLHSRCTALTHKSTRTIVARAHPAPREALWDILVTNKRLKPSCSNLARG